MSSELELEEMYKEHSAMANFLLSLLPSLSTVALPQTVTSSLAPPKLSNRCRTERPKRVESPHFNNATSAINARRASASIVVHHALSVTLLFALARDREARTARIKFLRKQAEASKRRIDLILNRGHAIKVQHRNLQTSPSPSTSPIRLSLSINHVAECRTALSKITKVVTHALTTLSSLVEKPPTLWSDFTTILESSKLISAARLIVVATQESRLILTQAGIVGHSSSPHLLPHRSLLAAFAIVYSSVDALHVEPTDFSSSEFGIDFIYGSRPPTTKSTTTKTRNNMVLVANACALVGATLALTVSAQNFTSTKRRTSTSYTAAIIPRDTTTSPPFSLNLDCSPISTPRLRAALHDDNDADESPARCVHALGAFYNTSDAFSDSFNKWKQDEVRDLVSPLSDLYRTLIQRRAIIDLESSRPFADQDEGLTQLREGINQHIDKVRTAAVRVLGGERTEAAKVWLSRVEPKSSSPSTLQTSSPTHTVIVPPVAPRSPLRSPLRNEAEPRAHVNDLLRNLDLIHILCVDENFTIPLPLPPLSLRYEGFNEGTSPTVHAGEFENLKADITSIHSYVYLINPLSPPPPPPPPPPRARGPRGGGGR